MTPELLALARRAVACPRWRWMPRMLAIYPEHEQVVTVLSPVDGQGRYLVALDGAVLPSTLGPYLPDFSDPATLGCLLVIVQEIVSTILDPPDGEMSHRMIYRLSEAYRALMSVGLTHPDTARALVAALESAP